MSPLEPEVDWSKIKNAFPLIFPASNKNKKHNEWELNQVVGAELLAKEVKRVRWKMDWY